ncbi:unnamed protein product [Amoebophrya sp. A25]|nr:unnamed protein product [Amoebophrya sp. A25]|eukprot:GSA25T00013588001.1
MSTYNSSHGSPAIWDSALYTSPAQRFGPPISFSSSSSTSGRQPVSYNYPTAVRFGAHPNFTGVVENTQLKPKDKATTSSSRCRSGTRAPVRWQQRAPRGKYAHYPHEIEQGLLRGGSLGWKPDTSAPKKDLFQVSEPESPRGKFARATFQPKEEWKPYKEHERNPRGRASRFSAELDPFPGRYEQRKDAE